MPNTSSATWPSLVSGARARASEVEAKFDFSEHHLWPHSAGTVMNNTYDLGNTTSAYWRAGYINSINPTSTANGLAIGTTTANASSLLDIAGVRALLIPRLTTAQRDALTGVAGMMIYNSTLGQFQHYKTSWVNVGGTVFRTNPFAFTSTTGNTNATTALVVATGGGRINGIVLSGKHANAIPNISVVLDGVTVLNWTAPTSGAFHYFVNPMGSVFQMVTGTTAAFTNTDYNSAAAAPFLGWDFATSATINFGSAAGVTSSIGYIYSSML